MQKLDRLGWAAGVSFTAFGLKIGIRVSAPAVPADLLDCLPPLWQPLRSPLVDHLLSFRLGGSGPRPGSKSFYLIHAGVELVARTLDRGEAFLNLEGELQRFIAANARDRVFIHAGVVEWQGRAIVLPGRSFAGKSTLVKALLAAGARYYSDEYAILDRKGRVHPYPRRLSIRRDGVVRDRPAAADLGRDTGSGPIPVGLVAFTEYRPGGRLAAETTDARPGIVRAGVERVPRSGTVAHRTKSIGEDRGVDAGCAGASRRRGHRGPRDIAFGRTAKDIELVAALVFSSCLNQRKAPNHVPDRQNGPDHDQETG